MAHLFETEIAQCTFLFLVQLPVKLCNRLVTCDILRKINVSCFVKTCIGHFSLNNYFYIVYECGDVIAAFINY